jgi:putative oxidoreductase
MTTRFSTAPATTLDISQPGRVPNGRIALWVVQIVTAGMFLFAGSHKLGNAPEMIAAFDAIGFGQWFRYATGGIEIAAAIALLIPSLAVFGALALVPTMAGAIATHLLVIGGAPTPAAVLLAAALLIVWARRDELARVIARSRTGISQTVPRRAELSGT